jgi:predicted alpha/beta hydrolase family esterase
MQQIVIIHGGDSYPDRETFKQELKKFPVTQDSFKFYADWKYNMSADLGNEYKIFTPQMPNKFNAYYDEWEIWFEKLIPFLTDGVVLVGHSQGGIFLAKYLSTHTFPVRISKLILAAAPHSLSENLGDFALTEPIDNVPVQCDEIHLFQSDDDPLVSFSEVEKYQVAWPNAILHKLTGRGHIRQDHFPELVEVIKNNS